MRKQIEIPGFLKQKAISVEFLVENQILKNVQLKIKINNLKLRIYNHFHSRF